jgi:hypothetical protein
MAKSAHTFKIGDQVYHHSGALPDGKRRGPYTIIDRAVGWHYPVSDQKLDARTAGACNRIEIGAEPERFGLKRGPAS